MVFPRQDYWSGLPFPSPGDFPYPGIEPAALTLQADCLPLSHLGKSVCTLSLLHVYFYLSCSTETYFLLGQFPHSLPITAHTYISALGESPS